MKRKFKKDDVVMFVSEIMYSVIFGSIGLVYYSDDTHVKTLFILDNTEFVFWIKINSLVKIGEL